MARSQKTLNHKAQRPERSIHNFATARRLSEVYDSLLACYGSQHWWPAEEPFEVIVGAILTQAAAWINVERAIANLKRAGILNPAGLQEVSVADLARLIYPCGYYNSKAVKLKAFAEHLGERYAGSLEQLFSMEVKSLRRELLSIHGIGEETADSIILYAARKPTFVIDAYARRIMRRLGMGPHENSYAAFQAYFMDNLPLSELLFNEYHALLVRHGKSACRRRPFCTRCCLLQQCPFGRESVSELG
jgi:endonuclease-3 related protein